MKKLYFSILLVIGLVSISQAQSVRLVLIEEATNASCGPCALQNPAFDVLLNQNRDKLTATTDGDIPNGPTFGYPCRPARCQDCNRRS